MPYVDARGLRIHYRAAGAGPNVFVLVHGNFASWRWWKPVLDRLPSGSVAFAPDLRGCGDTAGGTSRRGYTIPRLAEDLRAFSDALGLTSFHLVGHSLGSAVATQLAIAHPEKVRTLALVAPTPATGLRAMREGSSRSARLLRTLDPEHELSMALLRSSYRVHHALGTNRWMLRGPLAKLMPGADLAARDMELLLRDAARMSPDALIGFYRALHRWDVSAELRSLRVPTLVLAGGMDVLVATSWAHELAMLLPRGELRVWPDVGHAPQVERPDEFVQLLVAMAARSPVARLRTWWWRAVNAPQARPVASWPTRSAATTART
jgi:3-oxoadipate enol-lactonase